MIIPKGHITTKYIELKHKSGGNSVLIHPWNVEKQYHFEKPFFGFYVEIWSRISSLIYFDLVILEKNL